MTSPRKWRWRATRAAVPAAPWTAVLLVLALARTAAADPRVDAPGEPLTWDPAWGEAGIGDLVVTGIAAATTGGASLVGPFSNHWQSKVAFDEDVRSALRLSSERHRRVARDASDALLAISFAYPLMVDVFAVADWYRGSPKVAREMAFIDIETMAISEGIRSVVNVIVSRERPYGRLCGTELSEDSRDCDSNSRYYSFFSGHTSQAFVSAALTCSHHLHLPLYGGGPAELAPCFGGLGLAAVTGTLRILGDQHYLSDVLVGAAWGTGIGFLVPWLLRYRHAHRSPSSGQTVLLAPMANGISALGTF